MSNRGSYFERTRERISSRGAVIMELAEGNNQLTRVAPVPLQALSIKGQAMQNSYKGYNVFNAISKKSHTNIGVEVTCENNIFTIKGTATQAGTFLAQSYYDISLKPNVTYTGRITKISGDSFPTKLAFFVYKKKPSLTFLASMGSIEKSTTDFATGRHTFTEEDCESGLVGGVVVLIEKGATVDYTVRLDMAEGSYTGSTMPEYEPYVGNAPSPSPAYPQSVLGTVSNIQIGEKVVNTGIELLSIGDYRDELSLNYASHTLKKHQSIEKYTFTGNEAITDISSDGVYGYSVELSNAKKAETPVLCTHFLSSASASAPYVEMNNNKIYFHTVPYASADELASFLKKKSVTIYYVLDDLDMEIDYSSDDVARELFNYALPHNQDISLEILGDVAPYEIRTSYYTLK